MIIISFWAKLIFELIHSGVKIFSILKLKFHLACKVMGFIMASSYKHYGLFLFVPIPIFPTPCSLPTLAGSLPFPSWFAYSDFLITLCSFPTPLKITLFCGFYILL